MASFLNKWFFISVSPFLMVTNRQGGDKTEISHLHRASDLSFPAVPEEAEKLHPFHVSVAEIYHNAADKTLEISCKIFTDDFEKVLSQNYPRDAANRTRIDLINPPDKPAMDSLVKKYVFSHLSLLADGKPVQLSYIGFERDKEAVYTYVQADNIVAFKKIDITNKLMYDLFTDQVNIIHVIAGGVRKSTKQVYPEANASFVF